jgi:hypothetical protein
MNSTEDPKIKGRRVKGEFLERERGEKNRAVRDSVTVSVCIRVSM